MGEAGDPNWFSVKVPAALWVQTYSVKGIGPGGLLLGRDWLTENQSNKTQTSCSLRWTFRETPHIPYPIHRPPPFTPTSCTEGSLLEGASFHLGSPRVLRLFKTLASSLDKPYFMMECDTRRHLSFPPCTHAHTHKHPNSNNLECFPPSSLGMCCESCEEVSAQAGLLWGHDVALKAVLMLSFPCSVRSRVWRDPYAMPVFTGTL